MIDRRLFLAAPLVFLALVPTSAQQTTYNRLCDPSFENCRQPLIDLIRAETVGIDVGFWFMEDTRYATELILKHNAGVPVRVTVDSEAYTIYGYTGAALPVQMMLDAGIPIRDKTGGNGIFHFKTMIFAGQGVVEFSGANYSSEAFVPEEPYVNYIDEIIMFSDEASIVDSFKTAYDDVWTNETEFSNHANITGPLLRNYPTSLFDPELNFIPRPPSWVTPANPPWKNFRSRSLPLYRAETVGIDSIMYRITDENHTIEMIAAAGRGVPVRLLSEPEQYRSPSKHWHAYNTDLLYMAGVQIRHRLHAGQNHEKLTILKGQGLSIFGSSNWTSASAESQHEHNLFTTKPWVYDWTTAHFNRKWDNTGPVQETEPFVLLPPDTPVLKTPADGSQSQPLAVTLKWWCGPWAHKYDVYFGTNPTALPKVANDVLFKGACPNSGDRVTYTVSDLAPGTTYYWKVTGRTMANLARTSTVWSFTTGGGAPPAAGPNDVVLWAWKAASSSGCTATTGWCVVNDQAGNPPAAGGKRLSNPNAGAPKVATPPANPTQFFELAFFATAGIPYRLWMRGRAVSNSYDNDSVYAQFSDSVTSTGQPTYRIGTTSATIVMIEDCSGCGLINWGWNDNAYGVGALGPEIYFAETGVHTLRVQVREDGLSIDQIILSPDTFLNTAPGQTVADNTIYAEQGVAPLEPNDAPTVSLTEPEDGAVFTAPASVTVSADAADTDGSVISVEFYANGSLVGTDSTAPFSIVWAANAPRAYTLTAKAIDNRGGNTTSAPRSVTLDAGTLEPGDEIIRWASAAVVTGTAWSVVADATAAGGARLQNPNLNAPTVGTPFANPASYFELTFDALAGRAYRIWIRGRAIGNSYTNDSAWFQFSDSVTSSGTPTFRIGTTSAAAVIIEDGTSAVISNWGWADNGYGVGALGPLVYFATSGTKTLRVQAREDGVGIDQIMLSSVYFTTSSPGAINNDTTIYEQTP